MNNWFEHTDDNDNSYWESPSPFACGEDVFYFRIRQRLFDNRIEYFDASDAECSLGGDSWDSLEEAKAAFEEARKNILTEIENA